jgi:hypothetical protein
MAQEHAIVRRSVEGRILFIRGHKVLLDSDLAELYGVSVKRLNQQVKRNPDRFPADFMFQVTAQEYTALRLQIAASKPGRGGRRYAPFAFTEHGAIMAASVLNSPRAAERNAVGAGMVPRAAIGGRGFGQRDGGTIRSLLDSRTSQERGCRP